MSIRVQNLSKIYGEQLALDRVSFEAEKGDIVGLLGPNGAGKSTTMRILTGYLPQSEGTATVCGYDVTAESIAVRWNIGYLPEHNPLYHDMYVHEYLRFVGQCYRMKGGLKSRIPEIIEQCGLAVEQNKRIGQLSKGYRQRVGLAQALLNDPSVLILDEPTSGLDPNQLAEIRSLIKQLSRDKTVLLSTHIMQEVQAICNRAVIINKGQVVANDTIENIQTGFSDSLNLVVKFKNEVDLSLFDNVKGILSMESRGEKSYGFICNPKEDPREEILSIATKSKLGLLSINEVTSDLETIFSELTK